MAIIGWVKWSWRPPREWTATCCSSLHGLCVLRAAADLPLPLGFALTLGLLMLRLSLPE